MTAEDLSSLITEPTIICGEFDAEERQILGRKWKNALLASPAQCVRHPVCWPNWAGPALKPVNRTNRYRWLPFTCILPRQFPIDHQSEECKISIRKMEIADIDRVCEIDQISFFPPLAA